MTRSLLALLLCGLLAAPASAQFTGPAAPAATSTVAQVKTARLGSYVTLTGNVVAHQRKDYFTFRDASGEIRVEIDNATFAGRPVTPETTVRLMGEVDQAASGRYVWVKALEIVR